MNLQAAPRPWNGLPRAESRVIGLASPQLPPASQAPWIAFGNGRSYGDVCVNDGGTLLRTRGLDRYLAFDAAQGLLRVEAGVTFDEVLALVVPQGWFLPVTPGTRFVTVGGAVANDVHGKNHHRAGSFGCHVTAFGLLRSDQGAVECRPDLNPALFAATIGGLGLTGLLTWVEFRLLRMASPMIEEQAQQFGQLADFYTLSEAADADQQWDYTVAWIDCNATGANLGRGVFYQGRHASQGTPVQAAPKPKRVPITPPLSLINSLSLKAFNQLYYHRAPSQPQRRSVHYAPFFYPLDALLEWNRIYGPRGFYQHQCVVPHAAREAIAELLQRIAASGQGSFLAVLKTFGNRASPGLLSFPRPGVTLALDFPNHGAPTLALLNELDAIVRAAGGAIYPGKDARMSAAMFRSGFPKLDTFAPHIDPACSSSFWRRVQGVHSAP